MAEEPRAKQPVPGRSCDGCAMCCKLSAIAALAKPPGKWCAHAAPGKGCGIYAQRPGECAEFYCDWMLNPSLGPEWKPDKARFYMQTGADGMIALLVDPGAPKAWREPRFYNLIKPYAAKIFELGGMLAVYEGKRVIFILPDRDLDAGLIPDGHVAHLRSFVENGRTAYQIVVEAKA